MIENNNLIISVDGPAGSGKERIAKYISNKYNFFHLDSGTLYRRLAFLILKNNINLDNTNELKKYVNSLESLNYKKHASLRNESISKTSSKIATLKFVRNLINIQQKKIVNKMLKKDKGCVIDGRDIGSNVFKEAKLKLFIEVNIKIRAKRRHKQLIEQGEKSIYGQILKEIKLRDKQDQERKESPLIVPRGAIIIDNSSNFKETIKQINNALIKIKQ